MKPLVPRDWKTTQALRTAGKKTFVVQYVRGGKQVPAFNGSQTSKRNKKRPITLPGKES